MKAAIIAVLVVVVLTVIIGGWGALASLAYFTFNALMNQGMNITHDGRGPGECGG